MPMEGVKTGLPVIRDTDGYAYIKEDAGKFVVGAIEPEGKPLPMDKLPAKFEFGELPEDWEHFERPMSNAMDLVPRLRDAQVPLYAIATTESLGAVVIARVTSDQRDSCGRERVFKRENVVHGTVDGRRPSHGPHRVDELGADAQLRSRAKEPSRDDQVDVGVRRQRGLFQLAEAPFQRQRALVHQARHGQGVFIRP